MRRRKRKMITNIPPKTSIGYRKRKSIISKISSNLGTSSFGTIKSHRTGNPNNKSFGTKRKGRMAMHDYQKMGTKTLEKLLIKACEEKKKMLWAVQVLPSDENQSKLEKLGLIIDRLKYQIEGRR